MLPFFIIILIFLFAIRHVGVRVWRWDQPLRATRPPFPDNLRDFPMCPLRVLLEAAGFYMLHHVLSSRSASAAGCVRDVPPPRLLHGRLLIRHITGKLRALTVCISKSWTTVHFLTQKRYFVTYCSTYNIWPPPRPLPGHEFKAWLILWFHILILFKNGNQLDFTSIGKK
jgi:hypothetical protein